MRWKVTKKYDAEFSAEFVKNSGFLKENNPIYIIQSVKFPNWIARKHFEARSSLW